MLYSMERVWTCEKKIKQQERELHVFRLSIRVSGMDEKNTHHMIAVVVTN